MAKQFGYQNCQLSDFVDLAAQVDDQHDCLAFITLDHENNLIIYQYSLTGKQDLIKQPHSNSSHFHRIDCKCYQYIDTNMKNVSPSFLQTTWGYLDQHQHAINRLLLQSRFYCSCIKTKLVLIMALTEKFGIQKAIDRFNRVFHQVNLHMPLTKSQIMKIVDY